MKDLKYQCMDSPLVLILRLYHFILSPTDLASQSHIEHFGDCCSTETTSQYNQREIGDSFLSDITAPKNKGLHESELLLILVCINDKTVL